MALLEKYTIQCESEFVWISKRKKMHVDFSGAAKRPLHLPGRRLFICAVLSGIFYR